MKHTDGKHISHLLTPNTKKQRDTGRPTLFCVITHLWVPCVINKAQLSIINSDLNPGDWSSDDSQLLFSIHRTNLEASMPGLVLPPFRYEHWRAFSITDKQTKQEFGTEIVPREWRIHFACLHSQRCYTFTMRWLLWGDGSQVLSKRWGLTNRQIHVQMY